MKAKLSMTGPNALRPELMTDAERLDEAAEILARGVIRLLQRREGKSTTLSRDAGEGWLDFTANQSGHAGVQLDGDRR